MKYIKRFLRLLLTGTFVLRLYDRIRLRKEIKSIKNLDLSNISRYYKANKKQGEKEKVLLINSPLTFLPCIDRDMITSLLVSHKYVTETIVVIPSKGDISKEYLLTIYGVKKFVYIHTWKDIFYKILGLFVLIKNAKNLKYEEQSGWHIFIEGIDFGDALYDGFLRFMGLGTYRKMDIKFALYIIEQVLLFYRFREIIKTNNVTDLAVSSYEYMDFCALIRAAGQVNPDILVWGSPDFDSLNISLRKATTGFIRRHRIYESSYIDILINKYGKEKLLEEYNKYMTRRTQGNPIINAFEVEFAYKGNDINNSEDFYKSYRQYPEGKNIFVYSHVFVDAVTSRKPLHSDYYTWLYDTLCCLAVKSHKHNIYVKRHPSEPMYRLETTVQSVVEEVNRKYNGRIIYLDKKVHNNICFQIADLVITAAGSIAIEAVPHGVPVLVCSEKPLYGKADIAIMPETIEEYKEYLAHIEDIKPPSPDTVERAKLYFLLYERYFKLSASFLCHVDIVSNAMGKPFDSAAFYKKKNSLYNINLPLEEEPVYKMFEFMIENKLHDAIDFTK